jgi:peroxiredoxin
VISRERAAVAPDFSMTDSEGGMVRLAEYRGKKNVVLVFNRGFA